MKTMRRKREPEECILQLERVDETEKSTLGRLSVDGEFECYILEDPIREVKVYGNTAIPYGYYTVSITYSPRFKRNLPILRDVPGFRGVRIHPGNTPKDTDGCLLPGTRFKTDRVLESRRAFNKLFTKLKAAKKAGKSIVLEVT